MKEIIWNKTLPKGVSKKDHYNSFLSIVQENMAAKYLVITSALTAVIRFCDGIYINKTLPVTGNYILGYYGIMPIIVDTLSDLKPGTFYFCKGIAPVDIQKVSIDNAVVVGKPE